VRQPGEFQRGARERIWALEGYLLKERLASGAIA
jgi:hypothetical protein